VLCSSRNVRVLHNTFRRNGELGIHVGDSNHNLIKGNLIERNQGIAFLMEGNRNQVKRNRIRHSEENVIVLPGNGNVIAGNRVSSSLRGAIAPGIAIEDGRGNRVARDVIVDVREPGIFLGRVNPSIGGTNSVVRRNAVKNSGNDGSKSSRKTNHSLLKRNIAIGARDDGFEVKGLGTELTGNRALRSGDLGIEAARQVIDGGGNIARHNADPRQCTNIACQRLRRNG